MSHHPRQAKQIKAREAEIIGLWDCLKVRRSAEPLLDVNANFLVGILIRLLRFDVDTEKSRQEEEYFGRSVWAAGLPGRLQRPCKSFLTVFIAFSGWVLVGEIEFWLKD